MLRKLLTAPLRVWHRWISPALPPMCRFYPSCSCYAVEAIERLPLRRACALIVVRVLRCNPFGAGGYDPVPGADPDFDIARRAGNSHAGPRPAAGGPRHSLGEHSSNTQSTTS